MTWVVYLKSSKELINLNKEKEKFIKNIYKLFKM
jgi:hypothetical protein